MGSVKGVTENKDHGTIELHLASIIEDRYTAKVAEEAATPVVGIVDTECIQELRIDDQRTKYMKVTPRQDRR